MKIMVFVWVLRYNWVIFRLATEELLQEAKRGAIRAEAMGPEGWKKCPLPKTNKKFLNNTLKSAIYTNDKLSNNKKNSSSSSKKWL